MWFQDVLEDEKLLRWRLVEDLFKTYLEDVFKTSWRPTDVCWEITLAYISELIKLQLKYFIQKNHTSSMKWGDLLQPKSWPKKVQAIFF